MTFVTVEGLDGAGSTTLVEGIGQKYTNSVITSEPSDLHFGQQVRDRLSQEDSNPLIDFYLFMADRIHHINQKVKPAAEKGRLVVSDRYADSTRAYQPVALSEAGIFETPWDAKNWIESTMRPWSYEPDLTLYIDISVETAIERASGDEKYENRDFLRQVKNNYDALAESEAFGHRIVRIDGEQSLEKVQNVALGKLDVAAVDRL